MDNIKMKINQLSTNDISILEYISQNYSEFPNQNQIAKKTKIEYYTVSRIVHRLKDLHYIQPERIGKHQSWVPNKNKKREVLEIVRAYKNCKLEIENSKKAILRVHNLEYYFKIFIPFNYNKSLYKKRSPAYARFVLLKEDTLCKLELHLQELDSFNNTAQIFLSPFFMIVPNTISKKELEDQICLECTRRLSEIEENLKDDETPLGIQIIARKGDIAINDDWVSKLALKNALNNKFLDNSLKNNQGETEYKYKDAVKIIPVTLNIREFCAEKNINEVQFGNMFMAYHSLIGSPIRTDPKYDFYSGGIN